MSESLRRHYRNEILLQLISTTLQLKTNDISYECTATLRELECGPMPNVMAAQPNIGGALSENSVIRFLVPRRKVWLTLLL